MQFLLLDMYLGRIRKSIFSYNILYAMVAILDFKLKLRRLMIPYFFNIKLTIEVTPQITISHTIFLCENGMSVVYMAAILNHHIFK